jgi:hypothetical protein
LTDNEKEPLSDDFVLSRHRYQVEHPDASPESIAASKDFVRCIAFGVEGQYNDPWACMSTVVQTYKDFTGGWQWEGLPEDSGKGPPLDLECKSPAASLASTEMLPLLMTFNTSSTYYNRNLDLLEESERDATPP